MKTSIRSGYSERSLGSFTSPFKRIKAVAATVCICSSVHVYYKKRTVDHSGTNWISALKFLCVFRPRRMLCHFGLEFVPWSKAAKVEPHLSDIIISSHSWSRRGYVWLCRLWGRLNRGWECKRMPALFSHVLPSQWKHWKTTRSHQLSLVTCWPQEKRE